MNLQAADPGQVKMDVTQAKLVSKKQRTTAYIVNVIAPVYHPRHKINSTVSFGNNKSVKVNSRTSVLFANMQTKEDKLLKKYADRLYKELELHYRYS